jgi:hypothetical protein
LNRAFKQKNFIGDFICERLYKGELSHFILRIAGALIAGSNQKLFAFIVVL